MYVSILTGSVARENWSTLEKSFAQLIRRPPENLQESYLIQCSQDPNTWQMVLVWKTAGSYESCKEMLASNVCARPFYDAGSIPQHIDYQVARRFFRLELMV